MGKFEGKRIRAYNFRLYPSKKQEQALLSHLRISKELWNSLLEYSRKSYSESKRFPSKTLLQALVKKSGLYSQTAQQVAQRLHAALFRIGQMRKAGRTPGFPRFKGSDRMKILSYPQFGFRLGKKLKVSPFGEIGIKKHREIEGRIKTLILKRKASGKWFAVFTAEREGLLAKENEGGIVGIDVGLRKFATLSNGIVVENPRHFEKWKTRLALAQRKLHKRKKGSANRLKAKLKVARVHDRVSNARTDFLHRLSRQLVSEYSTIALEKLESRKMSEHRFGRQIRDASWSRFANMLCYKAEEAGCKVMFVSPQNTTKECSRCHAFVEKKLSERTHHCPYCGLELDRDLNAARNILAKATAGMAGNNAWGNEPSRLVDEPGSPLAYGPGAIHRFD